MPGLLVTGALLLLVPTASAADATPEQLQFALAPLAPSNVAIVVRPRLRARAMARLRRLRRSRLTTAA